ncbi:MAG: LON peptidase substrate-binding domain-containing protein [Ectothiorhodospiraceae bacterium]|nr:LON peptidase substrate-binding domain-containing protein [Ectothiorhodospiraceae bacterium]
MTVSRFHPCLDQLPRELAVFPLPRAVLLPGQVLALNVFEPRYLALTLDALASGRLFGMVQPRAAGDDAEPVAMFGVGCAGRITGFQETEDGRLGVQLTGVCRFRIDAELPGRRGYRVVRPDWSPFAADLETPAEPSIGLVELEPVLRRYLEASGLEVRWEGLRALPASALVDLLSTQLPLAVEEKQALVEAGDVAERARMLRLTLEMAVTPGGTSPGVRH